MSVRGSVLLVCLSVAIAVPLARIWSPASEPPPSAPPVSAVVLADLTERLERLERLAAAPRPIETLTRVPARTDAGNLAERVAALEQHVTLLAQQLGRGAVPADAGAGSIGGDAVVVFDEADPALRSEIEEAARLALVAEAGRTVLDPAAAVADKMSAHERLRRVPDAYTDAMVQELLRIAETHADGQVRSDVWRFFDGATVPKQIVNPLLRALAHDGDLRVREEAAETLGNYADDPTVLAALRNAAEHDIAESVRRKAQRTLWQLGYGHPWRER